MSSATFLTELYTVPGRRRHVRRDRRPPLQPQGPRHARSGRERSRDRRRPRRRRRAVGDRARLGVGRQAALGPGQEPGRARRELLGRALERLEANAERWDVRAAYWYAWRDTERGAGGVRLVPVVGTDRPRRAGEARVHDAARVRRTTPRLAGAAQRRRPAGGLLAGSTRCGRRSAGRPARPRQTWPPISARLVRRRRTRPSPSCPRKFHSTRSPRLNSFAMALLCWVCTVQPRDAGARPLGASQLGV